MLIMYFLIPFFAFPVWGDYFGNSYESTCIVMEDNVIFRFTDRIEGRVYLEIGRLEEVLKERDYKIKDIWICIHNHLKMGRFSDSDLKYHRKLKRYGFKGFFLLYSNFTKKVYYSNLGR